MNRFFEKFLWNLIRFLLSLFVLFVFSCNSELKNEGAEIERKTSENNSKTEGILHLQDAEIFYKIIGKGEPMIVIHGGPGLDHTYFLPQMAELASHFRLIFYDQRACGRSSENVDEFQISLKNLVRDIETLRDSLHLGKVHLLAHSWGGILGMQYAMNLSQKLESLILLNSMSPTSEHRKKEDSILAIRKTVEDSADFADIFQSKEFIQKESRAYEKIFRVMFRKEFFDRKYADSLTLTFPDSFVANSKKLNNLISDISDYDFRDNLREINTPTLIIYGDYDPLSELAGEELVSLIPGAKLEIIKNCGHFPFIEKKKEFTELVVNFLK